MQHIHKYLDVFSNELLILATAAGEKSNLVIGGSLALQLHGLNLGNWHPEDLDIIIFEPTDDQRDKVEVLMKAACATDYLGEPFDKQEIRSWKIEKNGWTMNVIYAFEPKPSDLLEWMGFEINRIDNIIDAKLSYSSGVKKDFLRRKDMWHLSVLKSNNFNVPQYAVEPEQIY